MAGQDTPPLAVDRQGNKLLSFAFESEDMLPADAPLPLSLVMLWHDDQVLMVFDRYRQHWELPGGGIEQGETPREAAVRELLEESGQQSDSPLRFIGYARFAVAASRRIEYAALFTGRTAMPGSFHANDEIEAIRWWNPTQPFDGPVALLDAHLAHLTEQHPDAHETASTRSET